MANARYPFTDITTAKKNDKSPEAGLKKVLDQSQSGFTQISICGYSSGGQAAIRNYRKANHKIGRIDPTLYASDLKALDSKVILSINPNPAAWKDETKGDGSAVDGRIESIKYVRPVAKGFVEETKTSHDKYFWHVLVESRKQAV